VENDAPINEDEDYFVNEDETLGNVLDDFDSSLAQRCNQM